MIEIAGIALGVVSLVFAFEAPRTRFLSMLGWRPPANVSGAKAPDALSSHDRELAGEIIRYTVPDGNGSISVITRQMNPENLPEHVRAEARAIDAKLPAFLQSHEALLITFNRLL